MKALSVILPNYNHAHWLRRSLRAHAEQADETVEILVVDDCSTDDSIAVIESLARIYPSIRLLRHTQNQGVNAGIRTGIDAATGAFLLFAGADDLVLPGLYRTAIAALRANPQAALFCSGTVLIDKQDDITGFRPITYPRASAGYVSPAAVRRAIRGTDNWFIGSGVVYRHAHLKAIGYFDATLGSLSDGLANRLLAFEHGFYFDPEVLSSWRRYADSYSSQVALLDGESEKHIAAAARWIDAHYPQDVRGWYAALFDRRYRYNLARLRLIWNEGTPNWRAVADLLKLAGADRTMLGLLAQVPHLHTRLMLLWATLRLRPFAFTALAAAWWRSVTVNRAQYARLQPLLHAKPPSAAPTARADVVRARA